MVGELTMPKLSDSMADAVILRWLKAPGESFKRGDALIEVETDKATVVYEAEDAGTHRFDPRARGFRGRRSASRSPRSRTATPSQTPAASLGRATGGSAERRS